MTEYRGRNLLIDQLLRAGVEVAMPIRERGVDQIAYADKAANNCPFTSRPIH